MDEVISKIVHHSSNTRLSTGSNELVGIFIAPLSRLY